MVTQIKINVLILLDLYEIEWSRNLHSNEVF